MLLNSCRAKLCLEIKPFFCFQFLAEFQSQDDKTSMHPMANQERGIPANQDRRIQANQERRIQALISEKEDRDAVRPSYAKQVI